MTSIEQFVKEKYGNKQEWFVDFVGEYDNTSRVMKIEALRRYLDGDHIIRNRDSFMHNGKEYKAKSIVLNYAKTILAFQKNYLLQTPVTFVGDEKVVSKFKSVNKQGKYDKLNRTILDKVLKYGAVYEYVYVKNKVIKSKLIQADEGYPVYDEDGDMMAFVEFYINDGISYYTVFTEDSVDKWTNKGTTMNLVSRHANLSGLPIPYVRQNELNAEGRSELEDWISLLDNMESILSKFAEATEKYLDPILITNSQQVPQDMPAEIVGKGLNLDDGGEAKYLQAQLDTKAYESVYKTLQTALLDISSTPSPSMGKSDISNLSEVSIRILFSMSNVKASENEEIMREGITERFEKIRKLLSYGGIEFSEEEFDSLEHVYHYAMPSNDREVIENLKSLKEMNSISVETILGQTPYIQDVNGELERLKGEGSDASPVTDTPSGH